MVEKNDVRKMLDINVVDMEFSPYVYETLIANNIKTVGDIVSCTEEEILGIFGKRAHLEEVDKRLSILGLSFKEREGYKDIMNVDELAKKLAKELLKDQGLKMKTLVFFDEKRDMLDEFYDEVILLRDAWDEKFNQLSERMQESSRGEKIEEIYELLDSISTSIDDAYSFIDELKERLEENE